MIDRAFAAMGTTVHLIGVGAGADELLEFAEQRVHHLEAQWSRFRPTSELCRLNERAGTRTVLTPETYDLVAAAVDGWRRTDGLFDPTLLTAVRQEGYDRSFDELPADRPASALPGAPGAPTAASAGCGAIALDPDEHTIMVPAGLALDFGGIAKGHTADLVVADLARAGLEGACANLGGDVRVWGAAPDGADTWVVDIQDPTTPTTPLAQLAIDNGAIVTSTRLRRRWLVDGVEHHHLIDPRTGVSAATGWAQVSVIAGTATNAEILVKALFLAGPARADLLDANDARAVLVANDGRVETLGFDD